MNVTSTWSSVVISQVAYHLGPLLYGQYILYHVLPSAIELIIAFGIIFGLNECMPLFSWEALHFNHRLEVYEQYFFFPFPTLAISCSKLSWLARWFFTLYNIEGVISFASTRPILCSCLNIYILLCIYWWSFNKIAGEGTGLLRLHSTYRHDLKIYSSDEGRVQV
jgi:hypothetical protein